jgi:hypothetical protein
LESDLDEAEDHAASLETEIDRMQARLAVTTGYYRCEIFGFSFEYPQGYGVLLDDFDGLQSTGDFGNAYITNIDETDTHWLTWVFTSTTPDLEASMDGGIQGIQEDFYTILGTRESHMFNGHFVLYQNYTVVEGSLTNYGVLSVFYCEDSNYLFLVQHISESSEVFPGFFQFLESIKCYNPSTS